MQKLLPALRDLFTARDYHRRMLRLAVPMALAGVLSSSLQIIDTLMIATLGDEAVAGVGLANRLSYLLSFFFAGVTSGVSIFGAQFWGEGNRDGLRRTLGLSLLLIVPIAAAFCGVACFLPQGVMTLFSREEAVIAQGCAYLRLMGPAYLFQAVTALMAALLKATERPSLPMAASTAGILTNILFNYLLIFGKGGFPALGARGAALATLAAALLEMLSLLVLARVRKAPVSLRRGDVLLPTRAFFHRYLKTTVPVLMNEVGWSLGVVTMTWVYSTMGTAASAAATVYETIKSFVIVCCVSIGSAGGILIGIELGAGRLDAAQQNARRMLLGGLLAALALIPLLLGLISPLLSLYRAMSPEAIASLRGMLIALASLFWIKMCNYNLINGVLRAGGDTRAAAAIDVLCMWGIAVPLVFFLGYCLKWPLVWVFPCTFAEDAVVVLLAYRRYRKGIWKQRLVD